MTADVLRLRVFVRFCALSALLSGRFSFEETLLFNTIYISEAFMRNKKLHFHKYRLQSKLILSVTAILILLPAIYFYFGEFKILKNSLFTFTIYLAKIKKQLRIKGEEFHEANAKRGP